MSLRDETIHRELVLEPRSLDLNALVEQLAPALAGDTPPVRGLETILLGEDEEGVRQLASEILTACGYHVLDTGDPLQALEIGAAHQGKIDLLLTDVVMPGLRGPALAAQVLVQYPDIRVLYMSGSAGGMTGARSGAEPAGSFLPKPFTPQALDSAVRTALDGPRSGVLSSSGGPVPTVPR